MHTVKGKKITVIHLLRAYWHQTFFSPSIREDQPFSQGENRWPLPEGPLHPGAPAPGEGRVPGTEASGPTLPRSLALGSPGVSGWAQVASEGGSGSSPQRQGPRRKSQDPHWVCLATQIRKGGRGVWGQAQGGILGSSQPGRVPGQGACSGRCSGWSPAGDRNSNGSIRPTLSLPANRPISPWNQGASPPGQAPGPPPLQSSTSAGAPSLGRV